MASLFWRVSVIVVLTELAARSASACATCGCGDPTLTAMGVEKPFKNRLRVSLELRYRTDLIGEPKVDQIFLAELRADAQVAWAPTEDLFLLATLPSLRRTVRYVNDAQTTTLGLGDLEVRIKNFVYRDQSFSPIHLVAILAGIKMPTAPAEYTPDGKRLPTEAQPGTGSWDWMVGVSYAFFAHPWSFYSSALGSAPLRGTSDFRASRSIRTTLRVQRQFGTLFAARLGTDTRLDARSFEDGRPERDSSGFIGFASGELVVSPTNELLFSLSASIPVFQALAGFHHEGPVFGFAAVYDW